MRANTQNRGFALLIVLIAIAIILMLAATQMRTLFIPAGVPMPKMGTEDRPWILEDALVEDGKKVKLPRSPKPQLDAPITVTALVATEDSDRGKVTITFATDGRVQAEWMTGYRNGEQSHTITAETAGNIDAKRTFVDDDETQDKSRLFFVAKGKYKKEVEHPNLETKTENGIAWVFGWLKPDHTVEGFVSIHRAERQYVVAYPFKTANIDNRPENK